MTKSLEGNCFKLNFSIKKKSFTTTYITVMRCFVRKVGPGNQCETFYILKKVIFKCNFIVFQFWDENAQFLLKTSEWVVILINCPKGRK